ncbi:MAG: ribonuclease T2 [Deltaproteobacteria bacterium]|nr:ribonuclease T2 [Deltaproteobacteria bacterium]
MRALLAVAGLLAAAGLDRAAAAPADFDYYVLSLSWSPQYCAEPEGARDHRQCGGARRFAFVLHGLWPQDERGFPADCAPDSTVPKRLVDGMLDIMPSPSLVRYQWRKHGTCSGLDVDQYFATARRAFDSIAIPARYRTAPQAVYVAPRQLEQDFLAANPRLRAAGLTVQCNGRYLRELRICLDKQLAPRACGRDVRDRCRTDELIVRPVK